MVPHMVTVGCSAPRSTSAHRTGQDLADARAGGEHEVDDVGQVAGVARSRLAGSGFLPLPDRRADALQVLGFEGQHGAAWLANTTGFTHGVGRQRAPAHRQGERLPENDLRLPGR
jgi:hypothetical protein